ncbi:MAG: transketolase [Clostridiales bacterium]|nr:transketolase [Clostridiales bacterium]
MNKTMQNAINAARVLSVEAIQKANSGHPGLPLGAAPTAYTLFTRQMNHCPKNPSFFNRDRFVLSAGHGSALLYSMLHLLGYGVTKEDLMSFRALGSKTPGHPEYGRTPGVETSTGPLGQGVANAVGFALAESMLAARFNKDGLPLVDHYTFALCGDGCMEEGIEYEAASLAGTWGLGKLIVLYDSNDISIEGNIGITFRDDVARRHEAQGWQVLTVPDGEDVDAIDAAITLAKADKKRPSLIIVKTTIGFGSPKAGSADCHGAPLGEENVKATKKALGYTAKPFEVPADVAKHYAEIAETLNKGEAEWNKTVKAYKAAYPEEYELFQKYIRGKAPEEEELEALYKLFGKKQEKADATRNSSGIILNKLADLMPNLVGGSADLGPSNKTYLNGKGDYDADNRTGRNLHFGIREHAMAAICNGMSLHGGFFAFCGTFFVFSDYMKNAMRMSALMDLNMTYVLTHDSIGVGEDGPTHQPVEQLAGLRSIPGLKVFRPADGRETAAAYVSALTGKGPTCIVCSRQNLAPVEGSGEDALFGGYIVSDSESETPELILMASGSETDLAVQAKAALGNPNVRVVSMPCMELFEKQTQKYRDSVLPPKCRARVAIEAACSAPWGKYVGLDGGYVCMDTFGASAPAEKLFEIYGFTVENVVAVAKKTISRCKKITVE